MSKQFFTRLEDRALLLIKGEDARSFLQGLVSIDVEDVSAERAHYGAFLTAQGKYLHDFFGNLEIDSKCISKCGGLPK